MRIAFTFGIAFPLLVFGVVAAPEARAHGGGMFPDPRPSPGPPRAPSIRCDCARADCEKCSPPGLEKGDGLSERRTQTEVLESWGDLGRVRITTTFRTAVADRAFEGYLRLDPYPLFAVTGASVEIGDRALVAVQEDSRAARRDYLWGRSQRQWKDPLLVEREGPGAVTVRVLPIAAVAPAVTTLEAFALLPAAPRDGVRVYRTENECVVVIPLTGETAKEAALVDVKGKRAILLLDLEGCRRRFPGFPTSVASVVDVPCIEPLREAIIGRGAAAVTDETLLVATHRALRAPANLFVGEAKDAPLLTGEAPGEWMRPALREPTDPPPPPPPAPAPPPAAGASSHASG